MTKNNLKDLLIVIAGIIVASVYVIPKLALFVVVVGLFIVVPVGIIRILRSYQTKNQEQTIQNYVQSRVTTPKTYAKSLPLVALAGAAAVVLSAILVRMSDGFDLAGGLFILAPFLLCAAVVPLVLNKLYVNTASNAFYIADVVHVLLTIAIFVSLFRSAADGPGEIVILVWFLPLIAPFMLIWSISLSKLILYAQSA